MRRLKKVLISMITLSMLLAMSVLPVLAEENSAGGIGYKYTITLYAGNHGTIDGAESYQVTAQYGDMVSFDLTNITVTDDKYYVKGVRLSGRDNNEVAPAFKVTGDADYVVAYGVKGDQVAYTVNYQDASGNALAESNTFYGNIGDKPVVAYRYIENYIPNALAMTRTLSDNAADNVFTFVYSPAAPAYIDVQEQGTTTVVTTPGDNTATPGTGGDNANATTGGGNQVTGDAGAQGEGNVEVTEPEELVDLDEMETPGGNVDLDEKESVTDKKGFPLVVAAVIGIGALAVLIVLILIVRKRIKNQR